MPTRPCRLVRGRLRAPRALRPGGCPPRVCPLPSALGLCCASCPAARPRPRRRLCGGAVWGSGAAAGSRSARKRPAAAPRQLRRLAWGDGAVAACGRVRCARLGARYRAAINDGGRGDSRKPLGGAAPPPAALLQLRRYARQGKSSARCGGR